MEPGGRAVGVLQQVSVHGRDVDDTTNSVTDVWSTDIPGPPVDPSVGGCPTESGDGVDTGRTAGSQDHTTFHCLYG